MRLVPKTLISLAIGTSLSIAAVTFVPANNPNIIYNGRIDWSDPARATYDWPGIHIETKFTGTSVSATFDDCGNWYNVIIDDSLHSIVKTGYSSKSYRLAENLADGEHTLRIEKRFETNWGHASLLGFTLDSDAALLATKQKDKPKIEFIGDSYMVGYGVESDTREGDSTEYGTVDPYTFYTNASKALGPLLSKNFDADYQINAYSGIGLVRNGNGHGTGRYLRNYYDYTLNSPVNANKVPPKWDFNQWQADVVVISLGINDFAGSEVEPADTTEWNAAYHDFLDTLRSRYDNPKFILMATSEWPHKMLPGQAKKIVDEEIAEGHDDVYLYNYTITASGLHWHPSVEDNEKVARELTELISSNNILTLVDTTALDVDSIYKPKTKDWVLDTLLPATTPPNDLDPSEVPQFIVVSSDDNGQVDGLKWFSEMMAQKQNPSPEVSNPRTFDGDSIKASLYIAGNVLKNNTVVELLKGLYKRGFEMGNHTTNHVGTVTLDWTKEEVSSHLTVKEYTKEVVDCNVGLVEKVGVKRSDIKGFRTPFIAYSDTVLETIDQQAFLYDASIISGNETWESIGDVGTYFWPYTMEEGTPSATADNHYTNAFDLYIGKHPGLWEMPVQMFQAPEDSLCEKYGTTPGLRKRITDSVSYASPNGKVDAVDYNLWSTFKLNKEDHIATLNYSLDKSYYGNRAPLFYVIHSDFYTDNSYYSSSFKSVEKAEDRRATLEAFIDYALTKPNVRFVSAEQLIDWLRDPQPVTVHDHTSLKVNKEIGTKLGFRLTGSGNLQLTTDVVGTYTIVVRNLKGQLLINKKVQCRKGLNNIPLEQNRFAKGIYVFTLKSPKGAIFNTKISL